MNNCIHYKTTVRKHVEYMKKRAFGVVLPHHEKKWWKDTENPTWKNAIQRTIGIYGNTIDEKSIEDIYEAIRVHKHYYFTGELRCDLCDGFFDIDESFIILEVDCDPHMVSIHMHIHCPIDTAQEKIYE